MAPGPTPVPPEVLLAQGSPLVYHRGPGYGDLLREVTESLKKIFRTNNDVLIFASSGTGGLESAVANLFSPGHTVIVPVAGYFGDRFARIAEGLQRHAGPAVRIHLGCCLGGNGEGEEPALLLRLGPVQEFLPAGQPGEPVHPGHLPDAWDAGGAAPILRRG